MILQSIPGNPTLKIAKETQYNLKKDITDVTINDEDEIITIYWND